MIIDQANINGVIEILKNNSESLKMIEFSSFLKEKPKMLPIDEIIGNIGPEVHSLIFRDSKMKIGPSLAKALSFFI